MLQTPIDRSPRSTRRLRGLVCLAALALPLLGNSCSSPMPLPTVQDVDLERFMGDWFVLAHIPASIERKAYNAVESYALRDDGKIATTYTFRKGGFDGPLKEYHPVGTVRDRETRATWDMQFLWPFQAEYLIVELDESYSVTIIGRSKLDYVWVMARTPEIAPERWEALEVKLVELGYDLTRLRRVPHRWPDAGHPVQARQEGAARALPEAAAP